MGKDCRIINATPGSHAAEFLPMLGIISIIGIIGIIGIIFGGLWHFIFF